MASQPSADGRAHFERWVDALSEGRRTQLSKHIDVARRGPVALRTWLMRLDEQMATTGATHIPPAEDLEDLLVASEELLRGEGIAMTAQQLTHWMETGEWPASSASHRGTSRG